MVFGGYMAASYLDLMFGQMTLVTHPQLGSELLMPVAFCFTLCLVLLALTHKTHPAAPCPASFEPRSFIRRAPQPLATVLVLGLMAGSFYGLAPLYTNRLGLPNEEVGLHMGARIFTGLLVQWPFDWLSDRCDRAWLICACVILLCLSALPLVLL